MEFIFISTPEEVIVIVSLWVCFTPADRTLFRDALQAVKTKNPFRAAVNAFSSSGVCAFTQVI